MRTHTGNRVLVRLGWALPAVALLMLLFSTSDAEARKRGFALITYGDTVTHVSDVPEEFHEELKSELGTVPKIGYFYNEFGVFWLNIWTWDGKYCLYADDTYWEADEEIIAAMMGRDKGELDKPFTYSFPPGLMLLLIGGAGFGVFAFVATREEDEEPQTGQPDSTEPPQV